MNKTRWQATSRQTRIGMAGTVECGGRQVLTNGSIAEEMGSRRLSRQIFLIEDDIEATLHPAEVLAVC